MVVNSRMVDAVAALFTAHWLESGDPAHALGRAASSIYAVLEATAAMGERELQLVAAQDRAPLDLHARRRRAARTGPAWATTLRSASWRSGCDCRSSM